MNEIKCEQCNKVFISKEALEQHNKARHPEVKPVITQRTKRKITKYVIILIIIALIAYGVYALYQKTSKLDFSTYTQGAVHWHAYPTVEICDEEKELPYPIGANEHLGSALLHTHTPPENYIHIEGRVKSEEDIKLGKYFDNIGVKFSQEQIFDTKNGDLCNGKPGKLKMFVNDVENFEFRNYTIKDQDRILIKYE